MKVLSALFVLFFYFCAFAQSTITTLEQDQEQYRMLLKSYEDSLELVTEKIKVLKRAELENEVANLDFIWGVVTVGHPVRDGWVPKESTQLGKVHKGDSVQVIDFNKDYYKILYDGIYGWVYKEFVKGGEDLAIFRDKYESVQNEQKAADKLEQQKRAEQARLEREKEENEELIENYRKRKSSLTRRFGSSTTSKILNNQVWIGMTKEMLGESLGHPQDINRTVTAGNVSEQWVYGRGRYVYLDNNIVTSWQD